MTESPCPFVTFGIRQEGAPYVERPAAYAVIIVDIGLVAAVRGPSGKIWLPGGGSLPGESPEDTLVREVQEELGLSIRLIDRIGAATQSFYAASDDCFYQMFGVYFLAACSGEWGGAGKHELISIRESADEFFHESHAWAARRGLEMHREGRRIDGPVSPVTRDVGPGHLTKARSSGVPL